MTKRTPIHWIAIGLVTACVDSLAAAPVEISGRILEGDGGPAVGVGVTFVPAESTCGHPTGQVEPVVTRTDPHGRYRLDLDSSVVWQMQTRRQGSHSIVRSVPPFFGPERMPPLRLPARREDEGTQGVDLGHGYRLKSDTANFEKARRDEYTAIVRVLDESSRPLPGAMVWALEQPRCWGRADHEGVVRIEGGASLTEPKLLVGAVGHAQRVIRWPAASGSNIRLPEARGLLVDAVHDVAKRPIEDVEVFLPLLGRLAWSDPQGLVVFRHLAEIGKIYTLERSRAGYLPRPGTRVVIEQPDGALLDSLTSKTLFRPSTITGRLLSEGGPAPAALRAFVGGIPEITSVVDDAGRFELVEVPNGRYTVVFEHGSALLGAENFEVSGSGERVDLGSIELRHGARVSGLVTDETGNPLAGASISVGRSRNPSATRQSLDNLGRPTFPVMAKSDESGSFQIAGLTVDARFTVVATHEGHLPRQLTQSFHDGEQYLEFVLPGLSEQTIQVISAEDDTPLEGAVVWVDLGVPEPLRDGLSNHTLRTTAHTTGEIRVLAFPGGAGRYDVMMEGFVNQASDFLYSEDPESEPLIIRLEPESVITGVVWDAEATPVPGVVVGVENGGKGVVFGSAQTDADGRFEARGLLSGPTTLIVRGQGYRELRHQLNVPATTEVELRLEPAPRFRLRGQIWVEAEGPPDPPVVVLPMGTSYGGVMTDADGWFEFDALAEGAYHFLVTPVRQDLKVVSGDRVDMTSDRLDWQILLRRTSDQL